MNRFGLLSTVALVLAFGFMPTVEAVSDKLDVEAAAKLSVLKKRLPTILADWNKKHSPYGDQDYNPKLRFIRRTSPTTAKITFLMENKSYDAPRNLVSIYLSYCDGAWTTTRKEVEWQCSNVDWANHQLRYLMLAIDEFDN
jgi:hypothetical protein